MKKFLCLILLSVILLAGCSSNLTIEKISKDLDTYKMTLEYNDEEKSLTAFQTLTYTNNTDTELNEIYFHLYPNNFSEGAVNKPVGVLSSQKAYPNGESYGKIDILSSSTNSDDLTYTLEGTDKDFLKVSLASPLSPTNKTTINLSYTVTLPNINHRFGFGNNTINIANFYPVVAVYEDDWVLDPYNYNGDPFYSNMANYEVTLTAPSNLILASTGEILSKNSNEEKITYEIKAQAVRDFAFVLSNKFDVLTEQVGHTTVSYFYYNEETPEEFLKASVDSLNTFNSLFGSYPYSTLNVVKANFVHGGMEYPNLVLISDDVSEKADYINVIVHEIAHQWWYGLVGNNEHAYGWLDEGLTEYSTNLFYRENPEYNINADEIIKNTTSSFANFVELYTSVLGSVDTSMNRALDEYDTEPEYVYVTYVKGMLFFDELRNILGHKEFMACLKDYFETYKFQNVKPEHLLGSFEKTSHTDLSGFFDSWISGKVLIESNN